MNPRSNRSKTMGLKDKPNRKDCIIQIWQMSKIKTRKRLHWAFSMKSGSLMMKVRD